MIHRTCLCSIHLLGTTSLCRPLYSCSAHSYCPCAVQTHRRWEADIAVEFNPPRSADTHTTISSIRPPAFLNRIRLVGVSATTSRAHSSNATASKSDKAISSADRQHQSMLRDDRVIALNQRLFSQFFPNFRTGRTKPSGSGGGGGGTAASALFVPIHDASATPQSYPLPYDHANSSDEEKAIAASRYGLGITMLYPGSDFGICAMGNTV